MPWLTCLPHCPSCLRPLFYNGGPTRTRWILQARTIPAQHSEMGRPSRTQEFIIWIVLPSSPSTELKGPSFINTCRYNLNISSGPSSWSSVCSLVWSLFSVGTEVSLMDANVVPECWPNRLLSDLLEEKIRKAVSWSWSFPEFLAMKTENIQMLLLLALDYPSMYVNITYIVCKLLCPAPSPLAQQPDQE